MQRMLVREQRMLARDSMANSSTRPQLQPIASLSSSLRENKAEENQSTEQPVSHWLQQAQLHPQVQLQQQLKARTLHTAACNTSDPNCADVLALCIRIDSYLDRARIEADIVRKLYS